MRLLIVEDDSRMRHLLRRAFQEDGYAVDVAENGTDGLWLARENPYDAIVLDRMLPGLDGLALVRRLRHEEQWTPVIMLTARGEFDSRIQGLDAGADDYLSKPFDVGELAARIRALVRRGAAPRPPVLSSGDLLLDPGARTVTRDGHPIPFTVKEFAVLELLLRNRGVVVTRSQMLDHLWDFAAEPGSNVVDQYIAAIRRKVDGSSEKSRIETVRGAGYRILDQTAAR